MNGAHTLLRLLSGLGVFTVCLLNARASDPGMQAFLKTYCIACHGPKQSEGDIRLDGRTLKITRTSDAQLWQRVLEALQFGEMPLAGAEKFPTRAEARQAESWIATALAQQGHTIQNKSAAEGYGNLVPHELLFAPEQRHRTVDVGARIWRVSPETLRSKLSSAARFNPPTNPFEFDKPHGNFTDFKGKYLLNSIMAEQVTELALLAAEKQTQDGRVQRDIEARTKRGATKPEAIRQLLTQQFQNVLRRRPGEAEMSRLMDLMQRIDSELGEPYGLQAAFA
ncbi:MAG: c-type cytochrome domain-containing protein, partial [Planctomycetaceae bacterium]